MASLIQIQLNAHRLMRQHGLMDAGWTFAWDNGVNRAGCCHYTTRQITLSKKIMPLWTEADAEQTILHEIAHALAGPDAHHGARWARIAREIGFTRGTRTHSGPTPPRPWLQLCPVHGTVGKVHRRKQNLICMVCHRAGVKSRITYAANPEAARV